MKTSTLIWGLIGVGFWIWAVIESLLNYPDTQVIITLLVAMFLSLGVKIEMMEDKIEQYVLAGLVISWRQK